MCNVQFMTLRFTGIIVITRVAVECIYAFQTETVVIPALEGDSLLF